MLKFTCFLGGPNGPKIFARRTKTDFKDRDLDPPPASPLVIMSFFDSTPPPQMKTLPQHCVIHSVFEAITHCWKNAD